MTAFNLTLPMPPSSNHLFVNVQGRGRVKSSEYNRWLIDAGWLLKAQKPTPITRPFYVKILIPRKSKRDIDNFPKSIVDLMVKHQIVPDDKHMEELLIKRVDSDELLVEVRDYA